MTAIRVKVTAEDIAQAGDDRMAWAAPLEDAIARAAGGVGVSIDGNGDLGNIATIGTQEGSTLVVELPAEANVWLDARWASGPSFAEGMPFHRGEPFEFRLELDDWLIDFFRMAE